METQNSLFGETDKAYIENRSHEAKAAYFLGWFSLEDKKSKVKKCELTPYQHRIA